MQGGIWFSHGSWLSGQIRRIGGMDGGDVGGVRVDLDDIGVPEGLYNEVGDGADENERRGWYVGFVVFG